MALHEVPIEPIRHGQRALEIDRVPRLQFTQVGPLEGFRPGLEMEIVAIALHDGQASTVDGQAVADGHFRSQRRRANSQPATGAFYFHSLYRPQSFDQTCEHCWYFEKQKSGSRGLSLRSP